MSILFYLNIVMSLINFVDFVLFGHWYNLVAMFACSMLVGMEFWGKNE